MPLKKKKTARERNTQCLMWKYDNNQKCREMKRIECIKNDVDVDDEESAGPSAKTKHKQKFLDSVEWKWTKSTSAGLFRAMGQYYDEIWFPTVIKEWCMLYYRSNHAADYWQYRDEWLSGDEEVRMAIWTEILKQRDRANRRREQCRQKKCQEEAEGKCKDPDAENLMEMYGVTTEEEAYRVKRAASNYHPPRCHSHWRTSLKKFLSTSVRPTCETTYVSQFILSYYRPNKNI